MTVSADSAFGVVSLESTDGLTFHADARGTTADGQDDRYMVFSGTLAAVGDALHTLAYTRRPNFDGGDTVTVTLDDGGVDAAGERRLDSTSIEITLNNAVDRVVPAIASVLPQTGPVNSDTVVTVTGVHLRSLLPEEAPMLGGGEGDDDDDFADGIVGGIGLEDEDDFDSSFYTDGDDDAAYGMYCQFGDAELTPATVLSDTELLCRAPSAAEAPTAGASARAVLLRVTNGVDYWSNSVEYFFTDAMVPSGVSPPRGPVDGGTRTIVTATNVVPSLQLACRFTPAGSDADDGFSVTVPAEWVSSSSVACVTPAMGAAGMATVQVSVNGQDFADSEVLFEYAVAPVVAQVAPRSGPVAGGTPLVVTGTGFVRTPRLRCQFLWAGSGAHAEVPATFVSPTEVRCDAPPSATTTAASVHVSTNGVDFGPSTDAGGAGEFLYVPIARVGSVTPAVGSVDKGTPVVITGTDFMLPPGELGGEAGSDSLRCRFSAMPGSAADALGTVPAVWVDGTVTCVAPPGSAGYVSVDVSFNGGVDFTNDAVQFRYLPTPSVLAVSPSAGAASGGSVLRVHGASFVDSDLLACVFRWGGDDSAAAAVTVDARWITPDVITCQTPAVPEEVLAGAAADSNAVVAAVTVTNTRLEESAGSVAFAYSLLPRVVAVSPASGSVRGGTQVTVTGEHFQYSPMVKCRFGTAAEVSARFVDATRLVCMAPALASAVAADVEVAVSINGADFSSTSATFQYTPQLVVTGVEPSCGDVAGGTVVTLSGTGFATGDGLRCVFGGVPAAAVEVVSDTEARCTTPRGDAGVVVVEASTNGVDFTPHTVQYRYIPLVTVSHVTPARGSAQGGTRVTVHGNSFLDTGALQCRFGDQLVQGLRVSATQVVCHTPALAGDAAAGDHQASVTVPVAITVNGQQFAAPEGVVFTYERLPVVSHVEPAFGPSTGGTRVLVSGEAFTFTSALRCRFGLSTLPAEYLSPTSVLCEAPPLHEQVPRVARLSRSP